MSMVYTATPLLRWRGADSRSLLRLEVCRDRACASPSIATAVSGDSYRVTTALAPGVWFWRLTADDAEWSTLVWYFVVRRNPPGIDSVSLRETRACDVDGDGRNDVVVGATCHPPGGPDPYVDAGGEHAWWGWNGRQLVRHAITGPFVDRGCTTIDCVPDRFGTGRSTLLFRTTDGHPTVAATLAPDGASFIAVTTGESRDVSTSSEGDTDEASPDFEGDGRRDELRCEGVEQDRTFNVVLGGGANGARLRRRFVAPRCDTGFSSGCSCGSAEGDFDGDGDDDLVLRLTSGWTGRRTIERLLFYAGGPEFGARPPRARSVSFEFLDRQPPLIAPVGDLDGDGAEDLGFFDRNPCLPSITVFRGRASGLMHMGVIRWSERTCVSEL